MISAALGDLTLNTLCVCGHVLGMHAQGGGYCSICGENCKRFRLQNESYLVGPEAPTVVNDRGGKQSYVPYRFDLLNPVAMFRLAGILSEGAEKYGDDNWRQIQRRSHLNHALTHIMAELAGDTQDDHLGHAFCRLMFALGVEE